MVKQCSGNYMDLPPHTALCGVIGCKSGRYSIFIEFRCSSIGFAIFRPLHSIATNAIKFLAENGIATFFANNPRPVNKWWLMSYVLIVSTVQICNPVVFLVKMKTDDRPLHCYFKGRKCNTITASLWLAREAEISEFSRLMFWAKYRRLLFLELYSAPCCRGTRKLSLRWSMYLHSRLHK